MTAQTLTISDITIKQDAFGRFCLNDLHKASGGEKKHQPANWQRLDQTIDLIEFLTSEESKADFPCIVTKQGLGTFVIKELVYSYAMWISAKFQITVIRAYDSLVNQKPYGLKETAPTYLTPEMCDHVSVRINELCKIEGKHHNTYYRALKDVFHANSYTLIPISKYADVCDWLGCKPICKMPEYIMVEASEIGELRSRRPNYDDDVVVSKSHLSVLNDFALGRLPYGTAIIDEGRYFELVQAEQKLKSVEGELVDENTFIARTKTKQIFTAKEYLEKITSVHKDNPSALYVVLKKEPLLALKKALAEIV